MKIIKQKYKVQLRVAPPDEIGYLFTKILYKFAGNLLIVSKEDILNVLDENNISGIDFSRITKLGKENIIESFITSGLLQLV